jgi:uncharacterized RDD family membrane protein YckC
VAFCAHCGKELPVGAVVCPYCATPVPGASAPTASPTTSGPAVSGIDALTKDSKAQDYWFRRVVAFIVDAIIVYVPLYIITFIAVISFAFLHGGLGFYALLFGTYTFLWAILFILYNVAMEISSGASFGKRFFNLKVVNKSGKNPTAVESFIRNVTKIYWLLVLLDAIVGLATSKEYNQKYTDKFAGTSITSTKP